MIGPRFVLRLAWREARAARRKLWLLTGSVSAGVAALVAINSFTENLTRSVAAQSQALLGADLVVAVRAGLPPGPSKWIDSVIAPRTGRPAGSRAQVASFPGMAYVPRNAGVRLVQVKAVEPGYPFYGKILTEPAGHWADLASPGRVLVDPSLLTALNATVGDTLALGKGRFVISATVLNVPGDVGVATAFGPRVFMAAADLPATELVRFGSRVDYETFVKLPVAAEAQKIADAKRLAFRTERVRIRTVEDDRENLTDTLARLGNYLGLVALIALLLGGLGVASATHVFIQQKLDTIAVLRCLGATSLEVFAIYLVQAVAMGLLGSAVGALLGLGVQAVLPALVKDLLPVDVQVSLAPRAILMGLGLGLWVSAVFALMPLLGVRRISPLATLRRQFETTPGRRDPLTWLAGGLLAASVVALSIVQVGNPRDGFFFAGGIAVVVLVLWLASLGMIRAVRRWFPASWPYLWRQGLANLYRPANQTVTVVLALGFGGFLLSTLFLVQHNLLREFRIGGLADRPNLMLFDIQPDQQRGVAEMLAAAGHPGSGMVPIVPMRIASLKGRPVVVDTVRPDSAAAPPERGRGRGGNRPSGGWAVRREYRSTYRDSVTASEKIVAGSWWKPGSKPEAGAAALISLDEDIAQDIGAGLGDEIVWDVQGVKIPTKVANLRRVDWGRFQTNFFVVFQNGVLDAAPQMLVTLTRVDSAAARGRLQRQVAERYPNVSAIDLSQVQQAIESVLGKAALAVRFLAFFSLAAGTIVLVGAVTTARFQRMREGVLLKTLGATRYQVLRILFAEYAALGTLSAATAIVLSSSAGWALAKWLFEVRFDLPILSLTGLTLGCIALTLAVGLWNSGEVLRKSPLAILREEG